MAKRVSKSNSDADFFNARLDEIRMSSLERLRAKASLARAEAFADAVAALINLVKRLVKTLVVRPYRHLTTAIG